VGRFGGSRKLLVENVLSPMWNAMQTAWDALMTTMRFVYDTKIHPMWTIIQGAVGVVKDAFDKCRWWY
jgi:hypothetical protein